MDIDELVDNFIAAFDVWASSPEGLGGDLFDKMMDARQALEEEQNKIAIEKAG